MLRVIACEVQSARRAPLQILVTATMQNQGSQRPRDKNKLPHTLPPDGAGCRLGAWQCDALWQEGASVPPFLPAPATFITTRQACLSPCLRPLLRPLPLPHPLRIMLPPWCFGGAISIRSWRHACRPPPSLPPCGFPLLLPHLSSPRRCPLWRYAEGWLVSAAGKWLQAGLGAVLPSTLSALHRPPRHPVLLGAVRVRSGPHSPLSLRAAALPSLPPLPRCRARAI